MEQCETQAAPRSPETTGVLSGPCPTASEQYTPLPLAGDVIGTLNALTGERAAIVALEQ
jgi:hypothetical protein